MRTRSFTRLQPPSVPEGDVKSTGQTFPQLVGQDDPKKACPLMDTSHQECIAAVLECRHYIVFLRCFRSALAPSLESRQESLIAFQLKLRAMTVLRLLGVLGEVMKDGDIHEYLKLMNALDKRSKEAIMPILIEALLHLHLVQLQVMYIMSPFWLQIRTLLATVGSEVADALLDL